MELTRTKHWGRIWSCVQSLMSPGILIGSGLTSYLGKPGFYACATCVLIGAGLIGFQLIDLTKCGSPQLSSSLDNDSPIPPAPPPISAAKYGTPNLSHALGLGTAAPGAGGMPLLAGGLYPLRRSISLQQPLYPCCRGESGLGDYPPVPGPGVVAPPYTPILGMGGNVIPYSPYCRECLMTPPPYATGQTPPLFPQMIRSYSLPQTAPLSDSSVNLRLKTTGTQTNPNSPVHSPSPNGYRMDQIVYPGSFERIAAAASAGRQFSLPEDRVIRDPPKAQAGGIRAQPGTAQAVKSTLAPTATTTAPTPALITDSLRKFPGYKSSVMFASNPQLFPASATQSSATSTTEERSFNDVSTPTPTQQQPPQQQQRQTNIPNHMESQRYLVNSYQNHNHHHPTSSRDYYPQREERRATFLRSQHQQRSFDSQKSADSTNIFPPANHHPRFSVSVEQHKRPQHHQKSQESINNLLESPKPPPPQSQKPPHQQPAFTRHYFDSSKIIPAVKRKQQQMHHQHHHHHHGNNKQVAGHPYTTPTISAQVHRQQQQQQQQQSSTGTPRQPQQPHYYPRWTQPQLPGSMKPDDPFADDDPPYLPAALSHAQTHAYNHRGGTPVKLSSAEFNIEPPKFNSLRRPGTAGSGGSIGGGDDTTRGSSISSQLNLASGGGGGGAAGHHQPYLPPAPPIHPSYTPSRAPQYHPGAVPVYPPFATPHHQLRHLQQHQPHARPQPNQQHPQQSQQQQQQQHHHPSSKNVSSSNSSITKQNGAVKAKLNDKHHQPEKQQQMRSSPLDGLDKNNTSSKVRQQASALDKMNHIPQQKSRQPMNGDGGGDDVEAAPRKHASSSRIDDDCMSMMLMNRDDVGPTIINLPPTIISGASPCPYCDVRRPQSSLSAGSRTTSLGRPGTSLSLSVPALQQIYPQQPYYYRQHYFHHQHQHYCSPPLFIRNRAGEFVVPPPPPPNARFLRRRNTWHVAKDYLEQITTSV